MALLVSTGLTTACGDSSGILVDALSCKPAINDPTILSSVTDTAQEIAIDGPSLGTRLSLAQKFAVAVKTSYWGAFAHLRSQQSTSGILLTLHDDNSGVPGSDIENGLAEYLAIPVFASWNRGPFKKPITLDNEKTYWLKLSMKSPSSMESAVAFTRTIAGDGLMELTGTTATVWSSIVGRSLLYQFVRCL